MCTYQFIWDGFFAESVVPVKYILVAVQKCKENELRDNLDAFVDKFNRDLLIEIFVEQGLVSVHIFIVQVVLFMVLATIANDIKSIHAGISNIQGRLCVIHGQHSCIENFISWNENTVAERKELDDLVSAPRGKKLKLRKSWWKASVVTFYNQLKLRSRILAATIWFG